MMTHEANLKFIEVAKLLGLEATYFSGLYTVKLNGLYVGQMSAKSWLEHIKICMVKAQRS